MNRFHSRLKWRKGLVHLGLLGGGITYWKFARGHQTMTVLADGGEASQKTGVTSEATGPKLQLKQVQVVFRHGARTPIHTFPKLGQAEYDPDFFMREHQASVFPLVRLSVVDGKPCNYSNYQKLQDKTPLKGGAFPGNLTTMGQEQMYLLGCRLRENYNQSLGVTSYDPKTTSILSTNIRRTILSARGVMAGYFGADHLKEYAEKNGPVEFFVFGPKRNILIPDTRNCPVLQTVNHAAQFHTDNIAPMKDRRILVEGHVEDQRQKLAKDVDIAQNKLNTTAGGVSSKSKSRVQLYNTDRRSVLYDPVTYPILQERARAIEKIPMFWSDTLCRHPEVHKHITEDDMKALVFLSSLDVEEFEGKFESGYRLVFQFEQNPFFSNKTICKEFKTTLQGDLKSTCTNIDWKSNGKRALGLTPESSEDSLGGDGANTPRHTPFFQWLAHPGDGDNIGRLIKDQVWANPLHYFKVEDPHNENHSHRKLDFIMGRDDIVAREAHGWASPKEVDKHKGLIINTAVEVLHYAMTGIHQQEKFLVTRLSAGPLIDEMFTKAQRMIDGAEVEKLCLYSSHDSTMAALIEALGLWDQKWPPFGVDLVLELHQDTSTGQFYVQLLYNNKVQKVRGYDKELVTWEEFEKTIKPYAIKPDEYQSICASNILEEIDKVLLEHEEDEDTEETKEQSETPAGM